MKTIRALAAACALAAGAWAADCVVERVPAAGLTAGSPAYDATLELKWDNGVPFWLTAWYTGRGTWIGKDFDVSTLSGYRAVALMRVYSGPAWPNNRWDGFRLGIYSFASVPGSLLWGPKAVIGTTSSYGWNNFSIGWTLPVANDAFVAAVEQYYNYPNCDPHVVDNVPGNNGHSWLYYGGTWGQYVNSTPGGYYNLMIRVVVDNETLGAAPTSLGRVKSLFH